MQLLYVIITTTIIIINIIIIIIIIIISIDGTLQPAVTLVHTSPLSMDAASILDR